MKMVSLVARLLLGVMFVFFGLNGFLNFLSMGPMPSGLVGQFIGALPTDIRKWSTFYVQNSRGWQLCAP